MNNEDWSLMQRVQNGEEEAIAELYERFGSLVFKSAKQVLSSTAEAEDAVQEVFIRLWQSAHRYDPERARLVTWVMLITRRHLIDRLRRRAARPSSAALDATQGGPDDHPARPQTIPSDEGSSELRRRLAELPDMQREVIERAYFQGFTLREVSEQLNTPLGTIKSALSRGLSRLRERGEIDGQSA
ncbi:MAG: sigma-70 family RNA polymerase sigma factor [Phycisphaerales bacterium]